MEKIKNFKKKLTEYDRLIDTARVIRQTLVNTIGEIDKDIEYLERSKKIWDF